ncbi:hypothetical protein MWN33_16085 [Starkeya koreensis]|uniref:Transcriptional regulator n=1 Tax=Ancylobacter koreensis TaxID=266121 RepID=A0ABT0DR10_9HYPH|nr:hypothetical protein [Ancylobacter koreensis]MCK0209552.1 hypothetical protein [Ancylobacter koreensis]
MAGGYDDREEVSDEAYEEAFETHRTALYDLLVAYADEHELSDGFLALLASDIGLSLRMIAYASETEKPSIGGLRLDLDRFARELGESVRDAKKHAAEFIAEARAAREEEEAEDDEDDEDGDTGNGEPGDRRS